MKKKNFVTPQDKKDWASFTKKMEGISSKEIYTLKNNIKKNKIPKLDLHGYSLKEANDKVESFIIKYFQSGYKKLIIVTGKGLRSKSKDNPYISESLSVLRNSVPEYIDNNENLRNKINKISKADSEDGGDGAIYIYLKKNKLLKNEF